MLVILIYIRETGVGGGTKGLMWKQTTTKPHLPTRPILIMYSYSFIISASIPPRSSPPPTHICDLLPTATKVAHISGDDRRIFIAQFRPDSNTKFVSCGVKHVRFWTLAGTQLLRRRGHLPRTSEATLQTMLSLAFAPVSYVLFYSAWSTSPAPLISSVVL